MRFAIIAFVSTLWLGLVVPAVAEELGRLRNGDPAMTAAFHKASATLPTFLEALRHRPAGADKFGVKVGIVADAAAPGYRIVPPGTYSPDGVEYFWVGQLSETSQGLAGNMANDGVDVPAVRIGQSVSIRFSDVADWMYARNGRLVGGVTICPSLVNDSGALKQQMRDEWGLDCR